MSAPPEQPAAPWRAVVPATALAVVLAVAWLLAPPMGTDLSAQVAHADFWRSFGATPVDLRWYGGSQQFGYSLVSPAVMAALGVRPTGALALVGSVAAFGWLLARSRVPRPVLGGLVGAVCIAGNLVSGRVTWALGVAFGLLALALLAGPAGDAGPRGYRRPGWWGAGLAALLASATSPVAGLFLGLVAVALLITAWLPDRWPSARTSAGLDIAGRGAATGPGLDTTGRKRDTTVSERDAAGPGPAGDRSDGVLLHRRQLAVEPAGDRPEQVTGRPRRVGAGVLLGVAAAVPLLVTSVLFGEGGWMNTGRTDTVHAVVASLAVAALVPRRVVRVGALLSAAGVLVAALVHTPVGLNATRLAVMFALPAVAAAGALPGMVTRRLPATVPARVAGAAALAAVLLVGWWWQPPLLTPGPARPGQRGQRPGVLRTAAGSAACPGGDRAGGDPADPGLLGGGVPGRLPAGPGLAAAGRHRPQPVVLHRHPGRRWYRRAAHPGQLPRLADP